MEPALYCSNLKMMLVMEDPGLLSKFYMNLFQTEINLFLALTIGTEGSIKDVAFDSELTSAAIFC